MMNPGPFIIGCFGSVSSRYSHQFLNDVVDVCSDYPAQFWVKCHPDNTALGMIRERCLPPHFKVTYTPLSELFSILDLALYIEPNTLALEFHFKKVPVLRYIQESCPSSTSYLLDRFKVPSCNKNTLRKAIHEILAKRLAPKRR